MWHKRIVRMNNVTEVVAALIWDNDKFMICQRPAHKARGLLWEFVGGKAEHSETKEQALIRECQEELAVILSVGDVFMDVVHEHPDITVHLTLFNATIAEGVPQKIEHNDIKWITPSEIPRYDFCPADEEILKAIVRSSEGTNITNVEKILAIQHAIDHPNTEELYYDLLDCMGDLKSNYYDYMTTEPINCEIELNRLPAADYDLCAALLTMLLREDHFSNGALRERYEAGQVDAILYRMIALLES